MNLSLDTILSAIAAILPLVAFIAYILYRVKGAKGDNAERSNVEALIESVLFQYVTDAERNYGSGTGQLKLSAVVGWIVDFLPDKYKTMFSIDDLSSKVENALRAAQDRWKRNPALLGEQAAATKAVGFAVPKEEE